MGEGKQLKLKKKLDTWEYGLTLPLVGLHTLNALPQHLGVLSERLHPYQGLPLGLT